MIRASVLAVGWRVRVPIRPPRNGHVHRKRHHSSRRARARSQAPWHVHRRGRRHRAPPPRLGGARQLHRRGDERLCLEHRRDAPRGRLLHHDCRRRAWHPGRQAPQDEEERHRGHLHHAARRRQVRTRQLQDVRRLARRRRQCRERAVEGVGRHRAARRRAVGDALQAGAPRRRLEEGRCRPRLRDDRLLPPRFDDLPEGGVRSGHDQAAAGGLQLSAQGRADHVRRRNEKREARLPTHRRVSPIT